MGVIYDGIVARFAEDTSRAFKMHEEPGTSQAYDSVSTYTLPATIEFYGIPFGRARRIAPASRMAICPKLCRWRPCPDG